MSAYGTMVAEARADRYYERLAEDAWNAAERQAEAWHWKRHGLCCDKRCDRLEYAIYRLTERSQAMTEKQQKHLISEYGGESWG